MPSELNKLIMKEIESTDNSDAIKDLAHKLLKIELDRWGNEKLWRFKEPYENEIKKAVKGGAKE